jgi:hypothetical protein
MMTRWLLVLAVMVLSVGACTPKAQLCAETCKGCCDAHNDCQPGQAQDACGSSGLSCSNCSVQGGQCLQSICISGPDGGGAGGGTGGGGGGAPDAGPTTYPDGGSRFAFWDGGTCTVKTDCPCFSSDDCGPGFTCHSEDSTGVNVFCIPGARGAGLVGEVCNGEADCASALCTDSSSAGMRCTALCSIAAECVPTLPRCLDIGFGVNRSICSP